MEENNIKENNINKDSSTKKSITLKIFVDEYESALIRDRLKQHNINLKNDSILKEKSLSEFLREIVLKSVLDLNKNCSDNDINSKINQVEKLIARNISLTFENIIKTFGDEEAGKILSKAKLNRFIIEDKVK